MQNSVVPQKVALITGAARRIGAEIARHLHEASFAVVIHYHESEAEARALCEQLNATRPGSAQAVQALLGSAASATALIQAAVQAFGRLDAVVNNASRFYRTHLGETTEAAFDDLLASNLKAPYFIAEAALPHLRATQGCIVNIADIHGEIPLRDYGVYSITKAGLGMATKVLAQAGAPDVRVNAVSPGSMMWPEGENALSSEAKDKIISKTLLQRHGTPLDIARAVRYLVVDAPFVTGQVLSVDGGRYL